MLFLELGVSTAMSALTHTLIAGLGDELSLTVNAGVGALAGDPLLPLGHVPGWGGAAARALRTWERTQEGGGLLEE